MYEESQFLAHKETLFTGVSHDGIPLPIFMVNPLNESRLVVSSGLQRIGADSSE